MTTLVAVYRNHSVVHEYQSDVIAGINKLRHERNGAKVYTECLCDTEFVLCPWCEALSEHGDDPWKMDI